MGGDGMNQQSVLDNHAGKVAILTSKGRYTYFTYGDITITFLHGKDLIRYLGIKEWDHGYIVVDCEGKVKGEYEDYIDLEYILSNLYMDSDEYLRNIEEVCIEYV